MRDYHPDKNLLNGRTILVTGAGDGIGRAVALACAERGATIILLGRTVHKLETVYDEIKNNGGPEPAIYPMNLEGASADDYDELNTNIDREFGRLDGLFNNAGWLGASTPIEIYDTELWYKVMQVNLNGPFLLTQACLPLLRAVAREPLALIHIDAHTDTWDSFQGSKFNHGAPFRRAVEEGLIDPKRTIQIGIRGTQNLSEGWDYSAASGMRVVFVEEFHDKGPEAIAELAREVVGDPRFRVARLAGHGRHGTSGIPGRSAADSSQSRRSLG